jgi:Spy/CpxP family protein refolding chaperone
MKPALRFTILAMIALPAVLSAQAVSTTPQGNRAALERQFRERTARLTKQRLGLTDAQLDRLEKTNARFAPQLRQLGAQERETRQQLRQELMAGNSANQQRVSDLLDGAIRLQKQRITIVEAEQKELAGFLTPVQRARYVSLQAQFRKRAEELSGQGGQRRRPPFRKRP